LTALFLKAYALVARDCPELRRTFVPLPWPHLYEHTYSESTVLVERDNGSEKIVLAAKVRGPENQSLLDIDAHLRRFATAPLESISDFRQLMQLGRLPRFLRRFIFWNTLSFSGYKKCKRFGTFMVGSLGNLCVEQCHPLTPLTTYLSFGPISPQGDVVVLVCYDHRVMDGRTVAQALVDLETTLNGSVLVELQALQTRVAA